MTGSHPPPGGRGVESFRDAPATLTEANTDIDAEELPATVFLLDTSTDTDTTSNPDTGVEVDDLIGDENGDVARGRRGDRVGNRDRPPRRARQSRT